MLVSPEERRLAACRRGDAHAWAEMVRTHAGLVYSVPRRKGLSKEDADDVFQRTFLALHAELPHVRSAQAIPKWLAVVAARETMRLIRRREARGEVPLEPIGDTTPDDQASADALGIEAAQAHEIRQRLAGMPDRCRELLTRLYVEEQPYDRISEDLSIPIGSIGPTRARCLAKLRAMLDTTLFE